MAERFAELRNRWPFLLNEPAYYEIALDALEMKHHQFSDDAFARGDGHSALLHNELSTLYRDAQPFGDMGGLDPNELQEHVLSGVERLLNDQRTAEDLREALDELHEKVERAES